MHGLNYISQHVNIPAGTSTVASVMLNRELNQAGVVSLHCQRTYEGGVGSCVA
jgi:hypothetical protein